MNFELPHDLEAFVQVRVASGQYPNEADVLPATFMLLERREKLLAHIDEGTEQLRSGQYTEFAETQQAEFVAEIENISRAIQQPKP